MCPRAHLEVVIPIANHSPQILSPITSPKSRPKSCLLSATSPNHVLQLCLPIMFSNYVSQIIVAKEMPFLSATLAILDRFALFRPHVANKTTNSFTTLTTD